MPTTYTNGYILKHIFSIYTFNLFLLIKIFCLLILMETIKKFWNNMTNIISKVNSKFVERTNDNGNKLDIINTLFASINILRTSSELASSKLDTKKITSVTKQAINNKRKKKKTYQSIKNINDNLIKSVYDKNNGLIQQYNFSLDKKHNCYIKNNNSYKRGDSDLFINRTKFRFVAVDCTQYNLLKNVLMVLVLFFLKVKNIVFA